MLKPFPEPLSGSAVIMRDRQFVYQIGRGGLGKGQPSGDDEDVILFLTDTNLQGKKQISSCFSSRDQIRTSFF